MMDTTWLCANCRELVIKDAEELFCTECAPLLPCRKCTAKDVQIALMLDTQAKENMRIDNLLTANAAELERLRSEKDALHEAYTIQLREAERLKERLDTTREECLAAHLCTVDQAAELDRLRAIEARLTAEGVAHALYESKPEPTDMVNEYWSWEGLPEELRALYVIDAKAVIAYVRGEE